MARLAEQLADAKGLAESRQSELEAILASTPNAVIVVDTDQTVIFANKAASDLTPARRSVGQSLGSWAEAANLRQMDQTPIRMEDHPLVRSLAGETLFERPALIDGESGPDTVVSASSAPIRNSKREITGAVVVIRNITEQVRAREELQRMYERERRIAETLQTSLLGAVPRQISGWRFETFYRAARDEARIGGDFYDVFRLTPDKVGIVIGDVSGKGLTAAVYVATAKYSIRSRAYESNSPARVMEQVNETLVREMEADAFITIFIGVLDYPTRTLTYANCGHAPAILWKDREREAVLVEPTGPIVGAVSGISCGEEIIHLRPGDEMILGTDGLFEIHCGEGFLELEGLLAMLADLKRSGEGTASGLVEHITETCGGDLRDDVAVLRVSLEREVPEEVAIWPTGL